MRNEAGMDGGRWADIADRHDSGLEARIQTTDPQQLAHELMTRTGPLARIYSGMGLGAGALLGAILLNDGGDLRLVGAAMGGVLGGFIGHGLGATRAAAMRLQAIAVLDHHGRSR
jgi:hypothetical protein